MKLLEKRLACAAKRLDFQMWLVNKPDKYPESASLYARAAEEVAELESEIATLKVKIEKRDKAKAKKEQKESLKEPTVYFYDSKTGIEKHYPVSEIACFSRKNP